MGIELTTLLIVALHACFICESHGSVDIWDHMD